MFGTVNLILMVFNPKACTSDRSPDSTFCVAITVMNLDTAVGTAEEHGIYLVCGEVVWV